MKRLLFVGIVVLFMLAVSMPAQAQFLEEKCQLDTVNVENTLKSSSNVHVKLTYAFTCDSDSYQGQMTKMIVSVPFTDVDELEVSDSFGSMKVLEGPEYVEAERDEDTTNIGVIFRRGLLISDESNSYSVTIEFDTSALVSREESTYTLKTEGLVSNPKVTIITAGITETTMQVNKINYELDLGEKVSIQETPNGCAFKSRVLTCNNLEKSSFDDIKIKWTKLSVESIRDKFQQYTDNLLPKVSDTFKNVADRITELVGR